MGDWTDDFKPVERPTDHRWRWGDNGTVVCSRCHLSLVARVVIVGMAPSAVLYVDRGVDGRYSPEKHGRCAGGSRG